MSDKLKELLKHHKEDPKDPFPRFAIAKEYEKQGEEEKALEWYEELVENFPEYIGTYYHLGKLHERLGDIDAAKETYKAGIEQASEQKEHHSKSELQSALMELEIF